MALRDEETAEPVAVIGAGPAGLTAAYQLGKAGVPAVVLEATDTVGGISQTVERDGWRFDIGGHRFFTKVQAVEDLWHEFLDDDEFLRRPRMSRILYDGRFFDYPIKPFNALRNLGPAEAVRSVLSYGRARMHPPRDQSNFEGWVAARFGRRLYEIFFKTYSEKVWGVPATEIQADWAAQRIKNLSLGTAIRNALLPSRGNGEVTSLIEEFQYPRLGPGMMWERARDLVEKDGGQVLMNHPVVAVHHAGGRAVAVTAASEEGPVRLPCSHVVSSMPLSHLLASMDPPAPEPVRRAAADLRYRDFLTVALVVPERYAFPDNWIYVHTPNVHVGRVQNFGAWSPYMVKDGRTCLGLEFFVNDGDELWSMPDDDLVALARGELEATGLAPAGAVETGYVVRMPRAYPVYDEHYRANVDTIRAWLEEAVVNVQPVGRNGMHKYNNQDHSMLTAMLAAENVMGASHDVWAVNVEAAYHESENGASRNGTGRDAPILPRRETSADTT